VRVAIYARYSTDKQDARSTEDQIRVCRRVARQRGDEVVTVFEDVAQSGRHGERPGLQELLRTAKQKPKPFDAVLVDDQSRLARDMGLAMNLIFTELPGLGIALVDGKTGLSSDDSSSRMVFGMNAIVNDAFLEMVRHETRRGMEGRAIHGFATGGRVFGYNTKPENNPPDPERPRSMIVINEEQAAVVRRVFSLFTVERLSLTEIAARLNADRVRAPHDGGTGNKIGRGWPHTTVRYMLSNERYVGRWTWNQSKWTRVPGKKQRRRTMLPREEWVVSERPDLAIVDATTWAAAQARFKLRQSSNNPRGSGRKPNGPPRLLSGLLQCGACGGSIVVISKKAKAGVVYYSLGCNTHKSRGASICPNGRRASEKKILDAIQKQLCALRREPAALDAFVKEVTRRYEEDRANQIDTKAQEKQVGDVEARIKKLTQAVALLDDPTPIIDELKVEQAKLKEAKAALAAAQAAGRRVTLHPAAIRSMLDSIIDALQRGMESPDVEQTRDLLRRTIGPIRVSPDGQNFKIEGGLDLAVLLEDPSPASASEGAEGVISTVAGAGFGNYRPFNFRWVHHAEGGRQTQPVRRRISHRG
jgi:DNA invertase Pin-like site-specific DNA recombinase